jgi:hypothetical protein
VIVVWSDVVVMSLSEVACAPEMFVAAVIPGWKFLPTTVTVVATPGVNAGEILVMIGFLSSVRQPEQVAEVPDWVTVTDPGPLVAP